jgi:hypothetical protein
MPVTGSPTQQNLDGSQVNRKHGNKMVWNKQARHNRMRVVSESETVIPVFSENGTHISCGRYDRKITLPSVEYSDTLVLKIKKRGKRGSKGPFSVNQGSIFRCATVSDSIVPLEKRQKAVKVPSEPKQKDSKGTDAPQCDCLGGATESVSCRDWTVKKINLTKHGKWYRADCLLSNGDYAKPVIIEKAMNAEHIAHILRTVHLVNN